MTIEELKNKMFWPHSFDSGFSEIERAIENARDKLKSLDPPKVVNTINSYYPYNYSNPWDQACYIFRYLYAYTYEYFMIFSNILEKIDKDEDLRVVSLGCGAMPDAWALEEAAKRMKLKGTIKYTGVDTLRWSQEYIPATTDKIVKSFVQGKAGEYLLEHPNEPIDILMFPKSIGDMYKDDKCDAFLLKKALGEGVALKDKFYVAFSSIDSEQGSREDKTEMDYFLDSIRSRGYKGLSVKNKKTQVEICNAYPPFPVLSDDLLEDSLELAGRPIITSREYENYSIWKFTKGI